MNLASKLTQRSTYRTAYTSPPLRIVTFPRSIQQKTSTWLLVVPAFLLISLFAIPLLALTMRAINTNFFEYVFSTRALAALRLSLATSLVTVFLTLLMGTPLAYVLARMEFFGKSSLELLIDLPVVLPPSVAGVALLIAFGRNGMFGPLLRSLNISLPFTAAAVVVAQLFVAAPLYVRAARIGFAAIDIQIEEAARVEGADPWQLFRYVMFPLAGRALISGAILTWARALGEFGATLLFAGNLEGVTQTMPMVIYLGFEQNLGIAIALSVVLVGLAVILLSITRGLEQRNVY